MGKVPYVFTESEETEDTSSSVENLKIRKKKFSILKYNNGNAKKNNCKVHSLSEPDDSEYRRRSTQRIRKLRGILKHDRDRETSEEDEDLEPPAPPPRPRDKYLVGRVPRAPGSRPGRGGGVAIVIRKNTGLPVLQNLQAQGSTSSTRRQRSMKRLARKRSC